MPAGTVGSDASALIYMTSGAGLTEVSCTVSLKTIGVVTTLGTFTAITDSNGYVFVNAPYVSSSDPTGSWIEVEISATSTATDDVTATLEGLYITYE
jgi:phosphatidate phosphatase APP1